MWESILHCRCQVYVIPLLVWGAFYYKVYKPEQSKRFGLVRYNIWGRGENQGLCIPTRTRQRSPSDSYTRISYSISVNPKSLPRTVCHKSIFSRTTDQRQTERSGDATRYTLFINRSMYELHSGEIMFNDNISMPICQKLLEGLYGLWRNGNSHASEPQLSLSYSGP